MAIWVRGTGLKGEIPVRHRAELYIFSHLVEGLGGKFPLHFAPAFGGGGCSLWKLSVSCS